MSDVDDTEKSIQRPSRFRQAVGAVGWFAKDQWFLICQGLVILIASQVQVPAQHQAVKQVAISYLSVTIIFFVTGCTLDTRILLNNYGKWRQHIFIQIQSFLMVSATTFAVVSLAATQKSFMDPWLLIGLILMSCQPTAMASNAMFTRQAHGNAPLTVVQTTIGNFIGPFISPVLVKMYLSSGPWYTNDVPQQSGGYGAMYRRIFMQFGLSVYLPLVLGQVFRYCFIGIVQKVFVKWKFSKISSLCLLTLLWQTFDHAFSTGAFRALKTSNVVFLVFIMIVFYFMWLTICVLLSLPWLDRKDTVAVAMCVPAKTLALGLPLTFLLFTGLTPLDEAKIQVPVVIYQVMQMGMASLCSFVFRRWVDAGEHKKEQIPEQTSEDEKHPQQQVVNDDKV